MIDYIAAKSYLSEKEARKFFRQIISAMHHCHQANVVHRDLKLENLLLNHDRNILISDFGLGRTFKSDRDDLMNVKCFATLFVFQFYFYGKPKRLNWLCLFSLDFLWYPELCSCGTYFGNSLHWSKSRYLGHGCHSLHYDDW